MTCTTIVESIVATVFETITASTTVTSTSTTTITTATPTSEPKTRLKILWFEVDEQAHDVAVPLLIVFLVVFFFWFIPYLTYITIKRHFVDRPAREQAMYLADLESQRAPTPATALTTTRISYVPEPRPDPWTRFCNLFKARASAADRNANLFETSMTAPPAPAASNSAPAEINTNLPDSLRRRVVPDPIINPVEDQVDD